MKNLIANFMLNFISIESISLVIARLISKLLKNASLHGGDKWDKSKKILNQTAIWINLFNEVYEDDEMTAEEEIKVANAIQEMTTIKKVAKILKAK